MTGSERGGIRGGWRSLVEGRLPFYPMGPLTPAIMEFKQCIVIREDLKLSSGKMAVQVAHGAILAMERAEKRIVRDWKEEGQRKIVLKAPSLQDVFRLRDEAERAGVASAIVIDAGLTEIPPGTVTALGLGPAPAALLDRITGNLKLV